MKFKAVLFDLDGTLLDTLQDLAISTNLALQKYGYAMHPVDAYRYFVGDGVEKLIWRTVPGSREDPALTSRMVREMRTQYSQRWMNSRLYDGIAEMLDGVVAGQKSMAVFSNKPHQAAQDCIRVLLSHWSFQAVLGVDENTPRKPDPSGAISIAAQLQIDPEFFAYLGDTDTDMKTALAAGMYPVGALWGFRTAEELKDNGAKVLLKHPTDLLQLL